MNFLLWYLLKFFLFDIHYKYIRFLYRGAVVMSHKFGLVVMLLNMFKPLFGFPGISARITGFVFRLAAVTISLVMITAFLLLGIGLYPLVIFLGSFLFTKFPTIFISVMSSLILMYIFLFLRYPVIRIGDARTDISLRLAGGSVERKLIKLLILGKLSALSKELRKSHKLESFLKRCELNKNEVEELIEKNIQFIKTNEVIKNLRKISESLKLSHIDFALIFTSILMSFGEAKMYFEKKDRDLNDVIDCLSFVNFLKQRDPYIWEDDYVLSPAGGVDKGWATGYTAELNKYSTDFTKLALKGYMPVLIGRDEVKKRVIDILSKPSKNNVMLIGESGCGKTTFVKALSREISLGTSISSLRYKRIVSLDIGALTAGSAGALNDRLTKIIKEIRDSGNVIVFIDEIHNLSSTLNSDPNAIAAFSTLEPHLSSGQFQFIGATSRDNYVKYIQPNESFSRNFDIVEMPEATQDETEKIVQHELKDKGVYSNPFVTFPSIKKVVEFAKKYVHLRVLPDSAVELMNQAVAKAKDSSISIVDAASIAEIVSKSTGIPVSKINESEKNKLLNLEGILHTRIIGQNNAITKIANAIKRARVQIRDENKPIASFLFAGPTGVGKTETAKALAQGYYGSEKEMIRLDMSEFQDIQSIGRLIGTESGGVGRLTSKVREKPYSLVLVDEIEKAHQKIQYLFLQVLDDGILTDVSGNKVDFSNTFIIMTTNIGTRSIIASISAGESYENVYEVAIKELKDYFPPEFLNRFTGVIPFSSLTEGQVYQIAELKLRKVADSLKAKHITIRFSEDVVKKIAKDGYNPEWGARPLNRVIEEQIETKIAEEVLNERIKSGDNVLFDMSFLQ